MRAASAAIRLPSLSASAGATAVSTAAHSRVHMHDRGEYPARPLSRDGSCESTPCDARTHQRRLRQARRYASTSGGRTIVRPTRPDGPGHGHPVVFGRALFAALRRADPAPGAKPVVRAHEGEAEDVVVDDAGAFTHIDTPEDYRRAFGAPPPDDSPAGVDPQAHPTYK